MNISTTKIKELSKRVCLVYMDNGQIDFTCPSSDENKADYIPGVTIWEGGTRWICNCKYYTMSQRKVKQPVCSHILACIYKLTGPTPLIKMIDVYHKSHPELQSKAPK
jgi:hypothetical protein